MAKKLLIVESPAKIKTIGKFLGKDFKIMSTVGHIKDLPPKKIGVTIAKDGSINIDYVIIENKDKTIADICKEASTASEIYLAPDPDREGEIIAWHIGQDIEKVAKKAKIHRIAFNEITEPAVKAAIENPGKIDLDKVAAQQARRILDRWVGYEVSPILWKKIAKGLSAGRVQSVVLRLVSDREEAIRNFKPEEYWTIDGDFLSGKAHIVAALTHIDGKKAEIKNQEQADAIVAKLKKSSFAIETITDKTRTKNPVAPFMTSTLQQAAFNQLGFSSKKTMTIAQKLYEGIQLNKSDQGPTALITYMRTDSLRISDTAITQVREYISKKYDKEYLPAKANIYEKKSKAKAQDAHEAIRPIDAFLSPDKVRASTDKDAKDAAKLYELIWKRFVACQMTPAQYAQRQVVIEGNGFTFKVTGSTLIFDGYLKVYADTEADEEKEGKVVIPASLKAKDKLDLTKIDPEQHFTQPPPKYTEASLVKEMEKEGIGRPSTYATILGTIQARAYSTLDEKKRFTPTELGMMVTKMLVENLPDIMDLKFTAQMEEELDKIAHGELERDLLLKSFYQTFQKDLEKFKGKDVKRAVEETEVECPECKKRKLIVRFGKSGEFLGCPGYPECKFTCNFHRTADNKLECVAAPEPVVLNEKCPDCGSPLRQVIGRFGPFIACSDYPNCKYIHKVKAKFPCPLDGGEVVQRSWRGGKFWGCANYPKCKFAVFGDIEQTPCPDCKAPFLVKKVAKDGTVTLMCHDKKCGYKHVEKP